MCVYIDMEEGLHFHEKMGNGEQETLRLGGSTNKTRIRIGLLAAC